MKGLARRNIHVPFDFISMQSHINKETSRKSFDIKCNNSQGMQKWPRKGKSQVFKKLSLAFDKVWFLNFVDINIEIFAGVNFAIAVNETLYFWHLVLSCRLWYFWNFFSEIYVALINWDIAFCIYKDIWKQSKSIIIIAVSINVITNDAFIIISILYIINELTELHELTFIATFLFLLIAKVHIGKLK